MSNQLATAPTTSIPANADDSLGIDREFAMQMARMPLLALGWVALAALSSLVWSRIDPEGVNYAPLLVICAGMILAAVIDGWAFKVPNWVTMPLVLSGWILGLLHSMGLAVDSGAGGFSMALIGTFVGFFLLFPMLAIGGVGAGDVKMQMGFGAWVGAFFGTEGVAGMPMQLHGAGVVFWAFCFGAIVGGVFGVIMILLRRQFRSNAATVGQILTDFQLFATGNTTQASQRAQDRRKSWVKLPYGIPLCVGFLLYLWWMLVLNA